MPRPVLLALLLSGPILGCGPSFKSVKATATLGAKVGEYSAAFDNSVRYCRALEKVTGTSSDKCAAVGKDAERWQHAAKALAGYSAALEKMAGQDDLGVQEDLKAVLSIKVAGDVLPALKGDTVKGIALAADALSKAITQEYRRSEIVATVTTVHPHLQALVDGILSNIALQREVLATLHETAELTLKGQTPDARFATYHFEIWLEDQAAYLSAYEKAARAFVVAHAKLAEHADRISTEDAEIYLGILASVHTAYKGVDDAIEAQKKP